MAETREIGDPTNWQTTLHPGDLIEQVNWGKSLVLKALVKEGFLTKEKAQEFDENYCFVFRMRGWFGSIIDKVLGKMDSNRHIDYQLVKIIDTREESSAEPPSEERFDDL